MRVLVTGIFVRDVRRRVGLPREELVHNNYDEGTNPMSAVDAFQPQISLSEHGFSEGIPYGSNEYSNPSPLVF